MSETILVAGAAGHLGSALLRELCDRGYDVRAIVRDASAPLPAGVTRYVADLREGTGDTDFRGVACLVSCVGAPIRLEDTSSDGTFEAVDFQANEGLFTAASAAGVERVVYVSIVNAQLFMDHEYVRAHEKAVGAARQSSMMQSVIRSTQMFSAFTALVRQASRDGYVTVIGDGTARINPIADEDLAAVVADAVRDSPQEVVVGGPETFTRNRIGELACEVAGVTPRVRHVAPWKVRLKARIRQPFNPRLAEAMRFHAAYSDVDCLGPETGTRNLREAFEAETLAGTRNGHFTG